VAKLGCQIKYADLENSESILKFCSNVVDKANETEGCDNTWGAEPVIDGSE
jgi:hypothetical protein